MTEALVVGHVLCSEQSFGSRVEAFARGCFPDAPFRLIGTVLPIGPNGPFLRSSTCGH